MRNIILVREIKDVAFDRNLQDFVHAGVAGEPDRVVTPAEWRAMSRKLASGLEGLAESGEKLDPILALQSGERERSRTLERAGITNTVLREEGGAGRGSLLATEGGKLPGRLEGLLYSPARVSPKMIAERLLDGRVMYLKKGEDARLLDLLDAKQSSEDLQSGPQLPLPSKTSSTPTGPIAERKITVPSDNDSCKVMPPEAQIAILKRKHQPASCFEPVDPTSIMP